MDTHEQMNGSGAPARMSDRAFGAAFAATLAAIGAVAWLASATLSAWLFVISGALLAVAFLTPELLSPLNALRARLIGFRYYPPPPPYEFRRIFAVIWWNTLFVSAGLLLVGLAGEAWFRLRAPFADSSLPTVFVHSVGLLRPPDTEVRITNGLDFWVISTTNSLGFMDREPPDPDLSAASCHIVLIGDSFVEGKRMPLHERVQVRLESLSSRELPKLNVAASAFGFGGTGQVHQLAYYDHYARRLRPNIVALVFGMNDFAENSSSLMGALRGIEPGRLPFVSAERNEEGAYRLAPPNPRFTRLPAPQEEPSPSSLRTRVRNFAMESSYWARWFFRKRDALTPNEREADFVARAEAISRLPGYESFLDGWEPTTRQNVHTVFNQAELPPVFQDALALTAFALDEFVDRTDRDGAELVILASHTMGPSGDPLFERMAEMARERGIPVINQSDYVARQGGKIEDAHFAHDIHWSAQGHQWAAEALLEWLRENPQVCDDADAA